MDEFIKQLSSPDMLETYSIIWISLKEVVGFFFNTELPGPVTRSVFFNRLLKERPDKTNYYSDNLFKNCDYGGYR
ncbi:MAG: hypothetical protein KKD32_03835, partial [Proteobacteria bacterium]|nr:hypothetical protein [Pseudomonadota bacterium]MBU1586292.1 hypothetical protein [Pseudomonadota bacterium]